jgi:saccharopine dehydrogenase-like NADP-dependent oxidoreductase
VLRESGFFSQEAVEINGVKVRPIDVTAKLLFPKWKLKPGEEEFTVMRIRIRGKENGKDRSYQYDLFDRTDTATGTLSMARTTGYTCTAVAQLVLDGRFNRKGICPPEYVGEAKENFDHVVQYLAQRKVVYPVKSFDHIL